MGEVDFPKIFQTSDQKDLEGMGPVSRFSSIILSNYQYPANDPDTGKD